MMRPIISNTFASSASFDSLVAMTKSHDEGLLKTVRRMLAIPAKPRHSKLSAERIKPIFRKAAKAKLKK
jgi:hypothetical protein